MFADTITDSMKRAISVTEERRSKQQAFNKEHGITTKTIIKDIKNTIEITKKLGDEKLKKEEIPAEIEKLTAMMRVASGALDFERAIELRNQIQKLRKKLDKMR